MRFSMVEVLVGIFGAFVLGVTCGMVFMDIAAAQSRAMCAEIPE